MTTSPTIDTLARNARADSRTSGRYARAYERKLDDDGLSIAVECPAPALLIDLMLEVIAEARTLYRRGALIVTESGEPFAPTVDVLARIHATLEALPEIADAREPYRDIRLLMATSSAYRAEYVRLVHDALRASLPAYRVPRAPRAERVPVKSNAERMAAMRERRRADEVASVEAWLRFNIDDPDDPFRPGDEHSGPELFDAFLSFIDSDDWLGDLIDDEGPDTGARWRVPTKRKFYRVADHVLGPRKRSARARYYVVPAEPNRAPYVEEPRTMAERVADAVVETVETITDARAVIRARRACGELPTFSEQRAYLAEFLTRRRAATPSTAPPERTRSYT